MVLFHCDGKLNFIGGSSSLASVCLVNKLSLDVIVQHDNLRRGEAAAY